MPPSGLSHLQQQDAYPTTTSYGSYNPTSSSNETVPLHGGGGGSAEAAAEVLRVQRLLGKKLGPEYLSQRQGGGGTKLTYVEGWRVINLANEVFGYNGWYDEVKMLNVDFVDCHPETQRFNIGVSAIVKVTLRDGTRHEDVGYGKADNQKSKAEGLDKARKEAVTDALKRALRHFGNLLGNCLYDKKYLSDVSKMKAPPAKFHVSELHRPSDPAADRAGATSASVAPLQAAAPAAAVSAPSLPPPSCPQVTAVPEKKASLPSPPASRITTAPSTSHASRPAPPAPTTLPPAPHHEPPAPLVPNSDPFDDGDDGLFAGVELEGEGEAFAVEADDSGFIDSVSPPAAVDSVPAKTPLQIEQARKRAEFMARRPQPPPPAPAYPHQQQQQQQRTTGAPTPCRQQSAPERATVTSTTAAQMLSRPGARPPGAAAGQPLAHAAPQRATTLGSPAARPAPGLRPAVPPAHRSPTVAGPQSAATVSPAAFAVNPNVSGPIHRSAAVTPVAGQLPLLHVGSAAARVGGGGGGVGPIVAKVAGGVEGGSLFMSAKGVKRTAGDGYDPTPPRRESSDANVASYPRSPLGELEVSPAGEPKRPRMQ